MTDREAMRALVDKAYAARDRGNVDELMAAFHSKPVFRLSGAKDALPVAETIEGHADLHARMKEFIETFEFKDRRIISFIFDTDRAAVHSQIDVTVVPKSRTFTTEILDLFRFSDGKIIELLEFADTALIRDMMSTP